MKIATYARFSTEMQRSESIADQQRVCRQYIARQDNWEETVEFHDAGISGGTSKRPGYQELLTAARGKEFDAIVCEDVSRLWRNMTEQSRAVEELQYLGVHVIGVNDGIDTRREGFDLLMAIKGAMNAGYRKEIGRRTHRGLTGLAEQGMPCGGKIYGYRTTYHTTQENGRPVSRPTGREIVEEEAHIIRQIFVWYSKGQSPRAIAAELNARNIPAPGATWKRTVRRIDAKWLASTLHGSPVKGTGILNNELYRGVSIWNRSQFVENPSTKIRERRERPESEWIKHDVPALRIVPDKLWNAVKQRQTATRLEVVHPQVGRGPKYLFSGLLKCALCGGNYVISGAEHYGCGSRVNGGTAACSNTLRVKRHIVETRLLEGIKSDLLTPEAIDLFRTETARLLAEARQAARPDTSGQRRQLAKIEQEIEHLLNAIKAGIFTSSTKAELERLEAEKSRLQATTADTRAADKVSTLLPRVVDIYKGMVERLAEVSRRDMDRARASVRNLLGGVVRLVPESGGLVAELQGNYAGMLKLAVGSQLIDNKALKSVVAGAGFEPTTFGL